MGSDVVAGGVVALWYLGSSWTRDRTYVPCTGRQILPTDHQESPIATIYVKKCPACFLLGVLWSWFYM